MLSAIGGERVLPGSEENLIALLHTHNLDHAGERLVLLLEHRLNLVFGHSARDNTQTCQALYNLLLFDERRDLGPDLCDDGCGRSGWRQKAIPGTRFEAWRGLRNRRQVGRAGKSLWRAHRNQADLVIVGERQ